MKTMSRNFNKRKLNVSIHEYFRAPYTEYATLVA